MSQIRGIISAHLYMNRHFKYTESEYKEIKEYVQDNDERERTFFYLAYLWLNANYSECNKRQEEAG